MSTMLAVGTIVDFQRGSFLNTGEITKVNRTSYRVAVRNVFGAISMHNVPFSKIYRIVEQAEPKLPQGKAWLGSITMRETLLGKAYTSARQSGMSHDQAMQNIDATTQRAYENALSRGFSEDRAMDLALHNEPERSNAAFDLACENGNAGDVYCQEDSTFSQDEYAACFGSIVDNASVEQDRIDAIDRRIADSLIW